jgi:hypothetical protein
VTYYARNISTNSDGTPTFETRLDDINERRVKGRLEDAWQCTLHRYPRLHAVDWYAERDQRVVGHVEIKTRSHDAGTFPTVYLNFRKYATLTLLELATGVPSTFVAAYTCGTVKWVRLADVAADVLTIAGTHKLVKSSSDREPMINVPLNLMKDL